MGGLILSSAGVGLMPLAHGAPLVTLCVIAESAWERCGRTATPWSASWRLRDEWARHWRSRLVQEIGDMLGPLTVGAIAQAFGLKVSFLACGALGLLSVALLARAVSTQHSPVAFRQPAR